MKFSIITPVYNSEKYIAETIGSVISQKGDFEIEYTIRDGGSTDKTVEIIKKYELMLQNNAWPIQCRGVKFQWTSEKDNGMYDAINKGFANATGDIFAWINADDKYLPDAFATVSNIFLSYPNIQWIKGINTTCDENGNTLSLGTATLYDHMWLAAGIYGRNAYFVQQDSVFWRNSLWQKARPKISQFRLAGDYALWIAFAQYEPLWSFNSRVSVFRKRLGQLSGNMKKYNQEQSLIAPHHFFLEKRVSLLFYLINFFRISGKSTAAKGLHRTLFPFHKLGCYIDFDSSSKPVISRSTSYLI